MRLREQSEALLGKVIGDGDKEAAMAELSRRIEQLEEEMAGRFNRGYLDVIDKCAVLERLHEDIEELRMNSNELLRQAEDAKCSQAELKAGEGATQRAAARLEEVERGLVRLSGFFDDASKLQELQKSIAAKGSEEGHCVFEAVRCAKRMAETKNYAKAFNFYTAFKMHYTGAILRLVETLGKQAAECATSIDYAATGRAVDFGQGISVFDKSLFWRKQVVKTAIPRVAYAAHELDAERTIAEKITAERRRVLSAMAENEAEIVDFATAFIMQGHFIKEHFPSFEASNGETFELIRRIQNPNIHALARLRKMLIALSIDTEAVDELTVQAALMYFNSDSSDGDLYKFLDDALKFMKNISGLSAEIDEILAKKIDALLCKHINSTGSDESGGSEFAEADSTADGVIAKLLKERPMLAAFDFTARKLVEDRRKGLVNEKYKDVVKSIKNSESISTVIESILELKDFMNEKGRVLLAAKLMKHKDELLDGRTKDDVELFVDTLRRNFAISK